MYHIVDSLRENTRKFQATDILSFNEVAPQREYPLQILMSRSYIRRQWQYLVNDPDRPRRDVTDPEEWIRLAAAGELCVPGIVQIKLADKVK